MFSGIVETAATVVALRKEGGNLHITMKCDFAPELRIDQSVAHNGVCLWTPDVYQGAPAPVSTFLATARLPSRRFRRRSTAQTSGCCRLATLSTLSVACR